jgi:hypothetical protein
MFEIYKITLPDGRTYYGQHNQERKKAGGGYYHGTYYGCGLRIKNYYKKHGITGVKKEVLYLCETQEEADRLEIKVISENKDLCCLNLTGGGRGLSTYNAKAYWTPERRRAQSEKAKKDFSKPETKKKHRESLLKAHQTDEYKETRSRISKRTWEEKKEQMVLAIHTSEKRKAGNEKAAKKIRELWKNKEWREKTLKEIRKGLNAEKSREKRAASTKKLWEKDGYREKTIRKAQIRMDR